MTRQEFILKHKHEIVGLSVDLLTRKTGQELSMYWERLLARVEAALGAVYDDAHPKPEPLPVKATPAPAARPHLNGNGHARVPA